MIMTLKKISNGVYVRINIQKHRIHFNHWICL